MPDVTLESLAKRVEALESQLAAQPESKPDWQSVVGIFDDDPEFMQQVLAEVHANREAEREAARQGIAE